MCPTRNSCQFGTRDRARDSPAVAELNGQPVTVGPGWDGRRGRPRRPARCGAPPCQPSSSPSSGVMVADAATTSRTRTHSPPRKRAGPGPRAREAHPAPAEVEGLAEAHPARAAHEGGAAPAGADVGADQGRRPALFRQPVDVGEPLVAVALALQRDLVVLAAAGRRRYTVICHRLSSESGCVAAAGEMVVPAGGVVVSRADRSGEKTFFHACARNCRLSFSSCARTRGAIFFTHGRLQRRSSLQ